MEQEKKKDVAEKVRALRKKLGLNQTEFARALGEVDQSIVSKWERGLQNPNGERALKLAELSGQSVSEWFDISAGRLTTHVLDTASGRPAAGLSIALYRLDGKTRTHLKTVVTNADGRCDAPLLQGAEFSTGEYELLFAAGEYLRAQGVSLPEPAFFDTVPIRFGMAEEAHYHVPLLISPYGYSTYRGS